VVDTGLFHLYGSWEERSNRMDGIAYVWSWYEGHSPCRCIVYFGAGLANASWLHGK